MQFTLLPISALLSLAAAQATTLSIKPSTSTACSAQAVLDACLGSTKAIASGCGPTDWNCLCEKTKDVLTCYNQCPNDPTQAGVLSNKEAYCANASIYTSSTTAVISRPVSSDPATTTEGSDATSTGENGAVRTDGASGTSSGSGASETNAAARKEVAGAMIGLVGLVGAFL